jgi:DNA-directed RNA polymerase subunit RPC12/RpoP
MEGGGTVKRQVRDITQWFGQPSRDAEDGGGPAVAEAPPDRRRVHATRVRLSPWTEDPETCETCGRRLLVGEVPAHMQRDKETLVACPLCASDLLLAGFRPLETGETKEQATPAGRRAA